MYATIHFSDKTTLALHEHDFLVPIVFNNAENSEGGYSATTKPVELFSHTYNGLIPSIVENINLDGNN